MLYSTMKFSLAALSKNGPYGLDNIFVFTNITTSDYLASNIVAMEMLHCSYVSYIPPVLLQIRSVSYNFVYISCENTTAMKVLCY